MHRGVDMRTDVLTGVNIMMFPERSRLVICTDFLETEIDQVDEGLWKPQRRSLGRKAIRQIDSADLAAPDPLYKIHDSAHC
jgi:hypothetical protein